MKKPFAIIEPYDLETYRLVLPEVSWSFTKNENELFHQEIPSPLSGMLFMPALYGEALRLHELYTMPCLENLLPSLTSEKMCSYSRNALTVDGRLIGIPREDNFLVLWERPDRLNYFGVSSPRDLHELADQLIFMHKKEKDYVFDLLSGTEKNIKVLLATLLMALHPELMSIEKVNAEQITDFYTWLYVLGVKNHCYPIARMIVPAQTGDHYIKKDK